jgi:hypothetical protein
MGLIAATLQLHDTIKCVTLLSCILAQYRASCNQLQPQKDRSQLVFQRPVETSLFEQLDRCGPVDSSPGLVFPNLEIVATGPGPVALPKMEKTGPDRTLNH